MEGILTSEFRYDDTVVQFNTTETIPLFGSMTLAKAGRVSKIWYHVTSISGNDYTAEVVEIMSDRYTFPKGTTVDIQPLNSDFYAAITDPNATEWQSIDFGFFATNILINSNLSGSVQISFDGLNIHGTIKAGYVYSFDNRVRRFLFVKGSASGTLEVFAWRNDKEV